MVHIRECTCTYTLLSHYCGDQLTSTCIHVQCTCMCTAITVKTTLELL